MIWVDISKSENSLKLLAGTIFLIISLYLFLLSPLQKHNNQIKVDIKLEIELLHQLDLVKHKLSTLANYPFLSSEQVNQQLNSIFQTQGIELNSLVIQNNLSVAIIKKIKFSRLLEILQQLKNQNGIVVTNALIERIEPGIVSVQLSFSSLLK